MDISGLSDTEQANGKPRKAFTCPQARVEWRSGGIFPFTHPSSFRWLSGEGGQSTLRTHGVEAKSLPRGHWTKGSGSIGVSLPSHAIHREKPGAWPRAAPPLDAAVGMSRCEFQPPGEENPSVDLREASQRGFASKGSGKPWVPCAPPLGGRWFFKWRIPQRRSPTPAFLGLLYDMGAGGVQ